MDQEKSLKITEKRDKYLKLIQMHEFYKFY
jgi:hypothetical protein